MGTNVAIVQILASILIALCCISSSLLVASAAGGGDDEAYGIFGRTLDPKELLQSKKETLTHFRFYWHDMFNGDNPTSHIASKPVNGSASLFGEVNVIDDPLTLGPDLSSKLVGRAQGVYAMADQAELGLIMAMNFALLEGKYHGSTITLLGRNHALETVRELSVVGGSGLFRLARGYAQLRTHTYDLTNGNAIVEYNVYVFHFE